MVEVGKIKLTKGVPCNDKESEERSRGGGINMDGHLQYQLNPSKNLEWRPRGLCLATLASLGSWRISEACRYSIQTAWRIPTVGEQAVAKRGCLQLGRELGLRKRFRKTIVEVKKRRKFLDHAEKPSIYMPA